jgi:pilus assembly protein CpaF
MMGDTQVPVAAIRRQIASAVHLVVQIKRLHDGSRKVTNITEVIPEIDEAGRYRIQDIFKFVQRGKSSEGKIVGEFIATGYIPSFMHEIELNRLPFPKEKFSPPAWYLELQQRNQNGS